MTKTINTPQLSAVKTRTGLQSIGDIVPRLIRQYELQAEVMMRRAEPTRLPTISLESGEPLQQATFAWFK